MLMSADEKFFESKWYIFGSATQGVTRAADIDILVICRNDEEADRLRKTCNSFYFRKPLDFSILTEQEESEVQFVERQNCIRIFLQEQ